MLPICILTIEDESDREFMAGVYTQYQWLMYDTIKQVMGDHWSAEDVVQITLVRLIDKLEKVTGKTVVLQEKVDKSVMGGISLSFPGKELDGTVRTRLDSLKARINGIIA